MLFHSTGKLNPKDTICSKIRSLYFEILTSGDESLIQRNKTRIHEIYFAAKKMNRRLFELRGRKVMQAEADWWSHLREVEREARKHNKNALQDTDS